MISYERECYSLLDFFGDQGGVLELFIIVVYFFTQPIFQFNLILQMMQQFYVAKTEESKFLSASKFDDKSSYYFIRLNYMDKIRAFFVTFSNYCCLKKYMLKNVENRKIYNMYN